MGMQSELGHKKISTTITVPKSAGKRVGGKWNIGRIKKDKRISASEERQLIKNIKSDTTTKGTFIKNLKRALMQRTVERVEEGAKRYVRVSVSKGEIRKEARIEKEKELLMALRKEEFDVAKAEGLKESGLGQIARKQEKEKIKREQSEAKAKVARAAEIKQEQAMAERRIEEMKKRPEVKVTDVRGNISRGLGVLFGGGKK